MAHKFSTDQVDALLESSRQKGSSVRAISRSVAPTAKIQRDLPESKMRGAHLARPTGTDVGIFERFTAEDGKLEQTIDKIVDFLKD